MWSAAWNSLLIYHKKERKTHASRWQDFILNRAEANVRRRLVRYQRLGAACRSLIYARDLLIYQQVRALLRKYGIG